MQIKYIMNQRLRWEKNDLRNIIWTYATIFWSIYAKDFIFLHIPDDGIGFELASWLFIWVVWSFCYRSIIEYRWEGWGGHSAHRCSNMTHYSWYICSGDIHWYKRGAIAGDTRAKVTVEDLLNGHRHHDILIGFSIFFIYSTTRFFL